MTNKLFKIVEPLLIWILGIATDGIRLITKWIQANPKTAQYVILFLGALSILAPFALLFVMVR